MEKEFETYEYLVKYDGNMENVINTEQQVVIVQENQHLIDNNKSTDYGGQEESTKEFESIACPMYNSSQQPVYFQLNNSSELIPISVDSIQSAQPASLFENNYLLSNINTEVVKHESNLPIKDDIIPYPTFVKEANETMDVDAEKLPGGYAEITLSDEQYEILKQKGWILLEIKDKAYLLDSSGLHEITHDPELITNLKHETSLIKDKNSQPPGCSMKVVMIPEHENQNSAIVPKQEACDQTEEPMEIITRVQTVHQEKIAHQMKQKSIPSKVQQGNFPLSDVNNLIVEKTKNSNIYLKTPYLLKDIPKEIILGKTVKGKNLIARVVKGKSFLKNTTKIKKDLKSEVARDRNINDKEFAKLIQQVLLGTADNCETEVIASVETVVSQMFLVPDLRSDLYNHKLIVTKTIREENQHGLIESQSEPIVITGRFIMHGNEGGFVHIPDMLQQHMKNSEQQHHNQNYKNENPETVISDDVFLHVNITETKDVNNIFRISVMVNKRYLSLSQVYNMKAKHINAVYACTACAKVFKSQEELEDHQECQCSKDSVTSNDNMQSTTVKNHTKMKAYVCTECKAKFATLKECQKHLKTHYNETGEEVAITAKCIESSEVRQDELFKCKMCENTYFHSASLTKHILAKHIKPK